MIQVYHLPLGAPEVPGAETQNLLRAAEQKSVSRPDPAGSLTILIWQEEH